MRRVARFWSINPLIKDLRSRRQSQEKALRKERDTLIEILKDHRASEVFAGLLGYGENFLILPWFETDVELWIQDIDSLRPLRERLALALAVCELVERLLKLDHNVQGPRLMAGIRPAHLLVVGSPDALQVRLGDLGTSRHGGSDSFAPLDQRLAWREGQDRH